MAIINRAKREINAKIVYYGLDGVGKGTSLRYVHSRIKPALRGEFKIQSTAGSELVFFDFCPFEQAVIDGYRLRFHIYTLHGKVANPAAWKMTLKGADGLVFVAAPASGEMAATQQGLLQMREFLNAYGVGLHDIPIVLQINKIDTAGYSAASVVPSELGLADFKSFQTTATSGDGVLEVLTSLSSMVLGRIRESGELQSGETMVSEASSAIDVCGQPSIAANNETLSVNELTAKPLCDEATLSTSQAGSEGLCVNVAPEGVCVEGSDVRIPIEISQSGEVRRLVLTVTVTPS